MFSLNEFMSFAVSKMGPYSNVDYFPLCLISPSKFPDVKPNYCTLCQLLEHNKKRKELFSSVCLTCICKSTARVHKFSLNFM